MICSYELYLYHYTTRLGGISLDFARMPPKWNENYMNTREWTSPARWDRILLNQLFRGFFVYLLLNIIKTFALHEWTEVLS